jgi:ribose-phosphate pyrophosphokinase
MISTGGTMAESVNALLAAGARPEVILAATHGLLLLGAREKLDHFPVREVLVTDTVSVGEKDWPRLSVISIAPLIAGALKRLLADGSIGDLY